MKRLTYILLSVVAFSGCGRVTNAGNASPPATPPQAVAQPCSPPNEEQLAQSPGSQSLIYGAPSQEQYVSPRYVESIHRPVVIAEQPVVIPAIYAQEPAPRPVYRARPRRVVRTRTARGHVRHKRSKSKSAAIVFGSAAAGAGLGALAGGGPGAAIGAASGGTAGFIYDRSTHNPR